MDLDEVLKKTKEKNAKNTTSIPRPAIVAMEERPYDFIKESKTNRQQNDDKVTTTTNKTSNKSITKWQQSDNKKLIENRKWKQSGSTTENTIDNKLVTNSKQTINKLETEYSFNTLVGLQSAIMIKIFDICKTSRSHITPPLTLESIANTVNTDKKTVKTT